jgi:hypothetical protein
MNHTSGPWTVDGRAVLGQAFDHSAKMIVDRVRGGSPEAADANARLIAAAPTMYQELELAADTFRDFALVLQAIGKNTMSAAAAIAERHIREQLTAISVPAEGA